MSYPKDMYVRRYAELVSELAYIYESIYTTIMSLVPVPFSREGCVVGRLVEDTGSKRRLVLGPHIFALRPDIEKHKYTRLRVFYQ